MRRDTSHTAEGKRLALESTRQENWKRWGPYLSERQWGTVREDYSAGGDSWSDFPHEQARSRAYRWGEDGLLGICDRKCRLCFSIALHNGNDSILKERLFGLTGPEGNHGEDVKESYFYLNATPTSSYLAGLYKYPQTAFPYRNLVDENRRRGLEDREYELSDTGAFAEERYFDVRVEYGKAGPEDIAVRITIDNRGPEAASLTVLPTAWFRNTWSWGRTSEGYLSEKPTIENVDGRMRLRHPELEEMWLVGDDGDGAMVLLTDNETNGPLLFGDDARPGQRYKDAFHEVVVNGNVDAAAVEGTGTKGAIRYHRRLEPGERWTLHLRLGTGGDFEARPTAVTRQGMDGIGDAQETVRDFVQDVLAKRSQEADTFYRAAVPPACRPEEFKMAVQSYAGLLWTKQFYGYVVDQWLEGDPSHPTPASERLTGRNHQWTHLYNRDVISMPDKWEYPWYAAWDLAFHMLPMAQIDQDFAKDQLLLFLREWYMHENGQIPAYEFALNDVNPPVHAWAAWRVYKLTGERGSRDRVFLARVFQKLLLNFTWWVNRTDADGNSLFAGGFLGLDNIGVFDRSKPLPGGGRLEQADGTAWMAFYCIIMLNISLELAEGDPAYEDMASKFLEHFVTISDAINNFGGSGLWDEADGFYYDRMLTDDGEVGAKATSHTMRLRSLVGLLPLCACGTLDQATLERLPAFAKRTEWFLKNRPQLTKEISYLETRSGHQRLLLAIPNESRLRRILRYLFDEAEFLSPYGIRGLSRAHLDDPFVFRHGDHEHTVRYVSGESDSHLFGGNSNWRGPVWLPMNYLIIEALERYHHFYGDDWTIEYPTGSGRQLNLRTIAEDLCRRLCALFLPGDTPEGMSRPCHGQDATFTQPGWDELILFYEYFDGDDGRGLGASHQTGWTSLVTRLLERVVRSR